jgi:SMI1 / KNR4 family (SUKH-1)
MRSLSELKINEGGKPVRRVAPSDRVINGFESHFGLKLPTEYVALLQHANGGHPEVDSIEPVGRPGTAGWAVSRFYHLDDDKGSPESLWAATEIWQRVLGKDALPFASDGGGNQFFLDLKTTPASVKVCVHDEGFRAVDLAPSFEVFIDGLAVDPDMI